MGGSHEKVYVLEKKSIYALCQVLFKVCTVTVPCSHFEPPLNRSQTRRIFTAEVDNNEIKRLYHEAYVTYLSTEVKSQKAAFMSTFPRGGCGGNTAAQLTTRPSSTTYYCISTNSTTHTVL